MEDSARCLEYRAERDSAQHALEECPAVIVRALLMNDTQKKAVIIYCEMIKETKERNRKKTIPAIQEKSRIKETAILNEQGWKIRLRTLQRLPNIREERRGERVIALEHPH